MLSTEPARFDWYAATVETAESGLVERAVTVLGDEPPRLIAGHHGYARGWEIRREGSRSAVVYAGGAPEWPHIVGTGGDAPGVADLVRGSGMPAHRVARVDVCVDTDTPGAFGLLLAELRDRIGVAKAYLIQPDLAADGATYYVGAKASEVRARLYEKGKQMGSGTRPHWVRYEVQNRPQKHRKAWAATASAEDLLGSARWARRFAGEVLGVAGAAPPVHAERVSDLDGAIATMCQQYGKRLLELLGVHGGDVEGFALELLDRAQNGGQRGAA